MVSKETISARVYRDSDFAVSPETETAVEFNRVRYNYGGVYDEKNQTRLVAPSSGVYMITAQCIWRNDKIATEMGMMWQVTIKLNGGKCIATDRQSSSSWAPFNHCSTLWGMVAGDYVEMVAFWYKPKGADINSLIRRAEHWDSPEFMMHKVG